MIENAISIFFLQNLNAYSNNAVNAKKCPILHAHMDDYYIMSNDYIRVIGLLS